MRDCHIQVGKYQRTEVRLPDEDRSGIFAITDSIRASGVETVAT